MKNHFLKTLEIRVKSNCEEYSIDSIKFWKKMVVILEKSYVNEVLTSFTLKHENILHVEARFFKENCVFKTYKIKRSDKKKTEIVAKTVDNYTENLYNKDTIKTQVSPSGMAAASQAVPGEFDSRHLLQPSTLPPP